MNDLLQTMHTDFSEFSEEDGNTIGQTPNKETISKYLGRYYHMAVQIALIQV